MKKHFFLGKTSIKITLLIIFAISISSFSVIAIDTSNSETICKKNSCSSVLYSYDIKDDKGNTIHELVNLSFNAEGLFISHKDFNITLSLRIKQGLAEISYATFLLNAPDSTLSSSISQQRFAKKFSHTLGVNQLTASSIDAIMWEFTGLQGVNQKDISIEKNAIVIKNIRIDFSDLVANNYTLSISGNPGIKISVGNLQANYKDKKIFLDPTITLNSSYSVVDYWAQDAIFPGRYVTLTRWNIGSIPLYANITNASLCFKDTTGDLLGIADNDLNLSRINNQTWIFSSSTDAIYAQLTNTTSMLWINETGGNTMARRRWWCANVTTGFIADYSVGNTFSSWWLEDPDNKWDGTVSTKIDDSTLFFGGAARATFNSSSASDTTSRPYLMVDYVTETSPPSVLLLVPTNNSLYVQKSTENFSCEVRDNTEIDNVTWKSDFRNGSFVPESQNYTATGISYANFSFGFNFSHYYDKGLLASLQALVSSTGRRLAYNGSDWWLSSYSSDYVTHLNSSYINQTDGFPTPSTWIVSIATNGTELGMIDLVSDQFYRTTLDGTPISDCSLQTFFGDYFFYSLGYEINNELTNGLMWVHTKAGTTHTLYRTWTDCAEYGGSFNINTSGSGSSGLVTNGSTFWLLLDNNNTINRYDSPNFEPTETYYLDLIFGTTGIDNYGGLAYNSSDIHTDNLYVTTTDGNKLTALSKRSTGSTLWNCQACDIYGNCNISDTNYTYSFDEGTDSCTPPASGMWVIKEICTFTNQNIMYIGGWTLFDTNSGIVLNNSNLTLSNITSNATSTVTIAGLPGSSIGFHP